MAVSFGRDLRTETGNNHWTRQPGKDRIKLKACYLVNPRVLPANLYSTPPENDRPSFLFFDMQGSLPLRTEELAGYFHK